MYQIPYTNFFLDKHKSKYNNNKLHLNILDLNFKNKLTTYLAHTLPYQNKNDIFKYKNKFLYFKKKRKKLLFLRNKILNLNFIYKLYLSSNSKTKIKKSNQLKHNFYNRKKINALYRKFSKIRKKKSLLSRRLLKRLRFKFLYKNVRKFEFFIPGRKRKALKNFKKADRKLSNLKVKRLKKYETAFKGAYFTSFSEKIFSGSKYVKFIVKLNRIKSIAAVKTARACKKHGFM